jgi:uncharacterized membrane protein YphA (DoxX/SURF4 family)
MDAPIGRTGTRRTPSRSIARVTLRELLQVALGLLMLATGAGKALDLAGFVAVLRTYEFALASDLLWPLAVAITVTELALGLWLLDGRALRAAALATAAVNAGYAIVLSDALLRGLQLANCGCFGVYFASPLRWQSPLESAVASAAALLLYSRSRDAAVNRARDGAVR